jgi:CRP/FNR family transcriptional regulator, anaerobic regulatory protein
MGRPPSFRYDGRVSENRPEDLPFWSALSSAGRDLARGSAQRLSFFDRRQIIARGDEVAGAYLVASGVLRVYFVDAEGREGTLYWVEKGQSCILALNCMFSRLAYPAWVESEGLSEVILIPAAAYRELFAAEPAVQDFTFEALSGRLFELMAMVEETASRGLEARVAMLLLRRAGAGGVLDLTHEQIASHLSTSREVVSRILRNLARAGLIESSHGRQVILDRGRLQRTAGG